MNKEKIVLSFVALFLGLIVAGVIFYFYQSTKIVPDTRTKNTLSTAPTPTPQPIYLSVDSPQDEQVVDSKIVTVSGKTAPDATVIISTGGQDQVVTPSSVGNFSTTVTIESGSNMLQVTSISPAGLEATIIRTVTYSTENF